MKMKKMQMQMKKRKTIWFVKKKLKMRTHEAFEKYGNAEVKEIIATERKCYAAQKNTNPTFTVTDLDTFNDLLILTGYHSLPQKRRLGEKEGDIGLPTAYKSIS